MVANILQNKINAKKIGIRSILGNLTASKDI